MSDAAPETLMGRAIEISRDEMRKGGAAPFAAVVVKDCRIVGEGVNRVISAGAHRRHDLDGLCGPAAGGAACGDGAGRRCDLVHSGLILDDPPTDFPPYETFPIDTRPIPPHGVLSSAASASAEKGRSVVDSLVPDLARHITAAFADMEP